MNTINSTADHDAKVLVRCTEPACIKFEEGHLESQGMVEIEGEEGSVVHSRPALETGVLAIRPGWEPDWMVEIPDFRNAEMSTADGRELARDLVAAADECDRLNANGK